MHGIYVRVTHTGIVPYSLHLQDIFPTTDGHTAYRRAGPVYVTPGDTITMTYTGEVAGSFETGTIRGFVNLGYLTAEILFGDGIGFYKTWSAQISGESYGELFVGGTTGQRFLLPDHTACHFKVRVVAMDTGATSQVAWWDVTGGLSRSNGAASTTLVGANLAVTQSAGGDSEGWTLDLTADTVNGGLSLMGGVTSCTGDVRFTATGYLTTVTL